MEIRQLQTFIAIVELGGFTKAAEQLGYAQSTITSHIQMLEDELGDSLFDRLGKKVVLTNKGEMLVTYARKILALKEEIEQMASDENEITGNLRIGVSESLTIYRLGKILTTYKTDYPKVNLILESAKCSELRSRLCAGRLDMVLTVEPEIKSTELSVKKLRDEQMVMIMAPEISFIEDNNTILEDSIKRMNEVQSIILSEEGCMARVAFENYLKKKGIKYSNQLEVASVEAIKSCAVNGLGIAVLPYYVVEKEIRDEKLKMVELDDSFPTFKTQLMYHKNKSISLAMEKLMEIIQEQISDW
ncbi:MAG: LysR family transcriptional regulator [Cellulosilyticum sp.]|nr:LysR family transcriptional regulator [Cellulosilyticum sp.]